MKMSAILIAAAALGVTAPAFAEQNANGQEFTVAYDAKHDKYCVSQMVTGSRLPQKDCRSKQDWAKDGVVIRANDAPKLASK